MGIFEGNTIKRLNKMMDKTEARKEKLAIQVEDLTGDKEQMRQAVETDLQESIINDRETSKKLAKDYKAISEELESRQLQLSQIDSVVQSEHERAKQDVDAERRQFINEKGEEFRDLFHRIDEAKRAYLDIIIEYHNMHSEYDREYRRTFSDVERRVGIRPNNPSDNHKLTLNKRHQVEGHYEPLLYPDESREAFMYGKLIGETAKNKNKYKKN